MYELSFFHKSTVVLERFVVIDSALFRAKDLSLREGENYLVYYKEPGKNRLLKAFCIDGIVEWAKLCPECKGLGWMCDGCFELGRVPEGKSRWP